MRDFLETWISGFATLCLLGALAIVASFCIGCGGPPPGVRQGLNVATRGLLAIDAPAAAALTAASERVLPVAETRADYDDAMRPYFDLELALRFTFREVAALDLSLSAWTAADQENWIGTAACIALGIERAISGAELLELHVPDELGEGLTLVRGFAGMLCPRAEALEHVGPSVTP